MSKDAIDLCEQKVVWENFFLNFCPFSERAEGPKGSQVWGRRAKLDF